VSVDDDNLEK